MLWLFKDRKGIVAQAESTHGRRREETRAPSRRHSPRARLSTSISDELVRRVVRGDYPPGSLLPSEPHLVAEFDVSRPVAREAVKSLEGVGLVTIRQGEGTVVRDSSSWNFLDPRVLRTALAANVGSRMRRDAVQLRLDLDSSLFAEAAPKLTPDDLAAMEAHARSMDVESSLDQLHKADLAFHAIYQRRAGNQLTEGIVHLLLDEMPAAVSVVAHPRESYDDANREHWAMLAALHEGRYDDALSLLRAHISRGFAAQSDIIGV